jgi:hypothetical protein
MFLSIRSIYFTLSFYEFRLNFETVLIMYVFVFFVMTFIRRYIYLFIKLRCINYYMTSLGCKSYGPVNQLYHLILYWFYLKSQTALTGYSVVIYNH